MIAFCTHPVRGVHCSREIRCTRSPFFSRVFLSPSLSHSFSLFLSPFFFPSIPSRWHMPVPSRRGEKTVNRGRGRGSEISFRGDFDRISSVSGLNDLALFSHRRLGREGSIFTSGPAPVNSLPARGEKIRRVRVLLLSTPEWAFSVR